MFLGHDAENRTSAPKVSEGLMWELIAETTLRPYGLGCTKGFQVSGLAAMKTCRVTVITIDPIRSILHRRVRASATA